ncbi:Nucleoporin POM152 [Neolecta irregularis DAH-3]|uniref:Nucleoporin POM152 n=1 Tax=Neolecta irregularis (strain DAH-3) TaxID=1198029 RepID=A0A1U7LJ46_NEOID|nr:Nucleoporin POM152 [Neolecta irregularis DAH-3]|eukprot:OLL22675.1 Nucleoporin POM152 [Neolecta irregularis DAH-3]
MSTPPTPVQETNTARPAATPNGSPLIPDTMVDIPTQRMYAIAFLGMLQALKLYDFYRLTSPTDDMTELAFAFKWLLTDGLALYLLPVFRIPWLCFQPSTTLIQIAVMFAIDLMLSSRYEVVLLSGFCPANVQVPLSALVCSAWKVILNREMSIDERRVKVNDIVFNSSRILGKHTVHVLPESTVKLGASIGGSCLCVNTGSTIPIPLRFNSTVPTMVNYSVTDFETSKKTFYEIKGRKLRKLVEQAEPDAVHSAAYTIPLAADKAGLYRLEKALDDHKLEIRVYRSDVLVVPCPGAVFGTLNTESNFDRCTNDFDEMRIRVSGLPPLKVQYSRKVTDRQSISTIESVQPDGYSSPLFSQGSNALAKMEDSDLSWAQTHVVDIRLNSSLTTAGDCMYRIEEVQDACGNIVSYKDGDNPMPLGNEQSQIFRVHERPRVFFQDCHPTLKLLEGRKCELPFQVRSQDPGPFSVELEYKVGEGSTVHKKIIALKEPNDKLAISKPGIYSLRSIHTSFCSGEVLEPSICTVITPPHPSLDVSFDSIEDKCTGSIGTSVDLILIGEPPFTVDYRIIRDQKHASSHRTKVERLRQQLRFTPEEAGHYIYEFTNLNDANYNNIELDRKKLRTEQTVFPLASAAFDLGNRHSPRKICLGSNDKIGVKLIGSAPFELHYDFIYPNGKHDKKTANNISNYKFTIETPELTSGGTYTVSLTTVIDSNGCKTMLKEKDVKLEVRRERPRGHFYILDGSREMKVTEGSSVKIPLRLTGNKPWQVSYRNLNRPKPNNMPVVVIIADANDFLTVTEEGEYELVEIKDSSCPGTLDPEGQRFKVGWLEKPSLRMPSISGDERVITRNDVCEGDEDIFTVEFSGNPPFTVDYDIIHFTEDGYAERPIHKELTAALPHASIRITSTKSGEVQYRFKKISDALYTDINSPDSDSLFLVKQRVNPKPTANFANPGKTYSYCLNTDPEDTDTEGIPLKLEGTAPFALEIEIKHEISGRTDSFNSFSITKNSYELRLPAQAMTLGRHRIRIAKITDANGCARYIDPNSAGHITISVTEIPSIHPVDERTWYCVGDRISYNLAGQAPWQIEYEFQGKRRVASSPTGTFTRIAEKPGNWTIISVSDRGSNCKATVGLSKPIYDIPSVRVAQGNSIVEDIHEGMLLPPFSFTYARTEVVDKKRKTKPKIYETHTVQTNEHVYSLFTSQEGSYEVISLQDARCRYPHDLSTSQKLLKNAL